MQTLWPDIRYRLHALLKNPAFTAIFATFLLGIVAKAALFCVASSYAQPERVASGMVAALTLARILLNVWFIWFGIRTIC
jgi:formate hydrogenlyase subunit 3/multisubunit Na+/H+ antiporter MnhD subunit